MKTITLKTDDRFFEKVGKLAKDFHLTKSELIRRAVLEYEKVMMKRLMKERMKSASLKVREADREIVEEFDMTVEDGLRSV